MKKRSEYYISIVPTNQRQKGTNNKRSIVDERVMPFSKALEDILEFNPDIISSTPTTQRVVSGTMTVDKDYNVIANTSSSNVVIPTEEPIGTTRFITNEAQYVTHVILNNGEDYEYNGDTITSGVINLEPYATIMFMKVSETVWVATNLTSKSTTGDPVQNFTPGVGANLSNNAKYTEVVDASSGDVILPDTTPVGGEVVVVNKDPNWTLKVTSTGKTIQGFADFLMLPDSTTTFVRSTFTDWLAFSTKGVVTTIANNVSLGTDQATAAPLDHAEYQSVFSTGTATGVRLPLIADVVFQNKMVIYEYNGTDVNLYPASGNSIGSLAVDAPYVLTANSSVVLSRQSGANWSILPV